MFQSARSLRVFLISGVVLANVFVNALLISTQMQAKTRYEAAASATVDNISRLLDQNIGDLTVKVDLSLRDISDVLGKELARERRLDGRRVNALLDDRRNWLNGMADFRVTDETGVVRFGPGVSSAITASYADRDFFKVHQQRADAGVLLTNPVLGRVSKLWVVVYSRRYNHPDGRFAGVVAGAVPISNLSRLLSGLDLGSHGVVALRDSNNALITRDPQVAGPTGEIGSKVMSSAYEAIVGSGAREKIYYNRQAGEGVARMISYRRLSAVPYHLVVGIGEDDYLAEWHNEVRKAVAFAAIFLAVTLVSARLLWRFFNAMEHANLHSRLLLKHASDGIHILDREGNLVQANDSFCAMLGYAQAEMIGMNVRQWDDSLESDDIPRVLAHLFGSGSATTFETRHKSRTGSVIDVEISAYSVELDGRSVLYCSSRDISERKRIEQSLRQSEDRYRAAFQTSLDAINITRIADGTYLEVNPGFLDMTGYGRDEVIGHSSLDLHIWADPAERQILVNALQRDGKLGNLEARFLKKNGEMIWGLMSAASIELNGEPCILSITRDITERKHAEEALRESQIRHELALKATNDVIWDWDVVRDTQVWNEAGRSIFGWSEIVSEPKDGNWWIERLHPDERARVRAGFFKVLADPSEPFWRDEYRFRCADGHYVQVMDRGYIQRDGQGKAVRMVGAMQDVSAQKSAEEELDRYRHRLEELVEQRTAALMETEAKASDLLRSSADGLYGVDRDGSITFINPAACAMLGYEASEVIGKSAHALFHHSKPDGTPYPIDLCPSHDAVRRGHQIRVDNEVYWRSNGRAVPVMYAVHPTIHGGVNTGAVISIVDMSEQRAASEARERALVAAENLAQVRSDFLANMSHEIRTPLNGVLGFAEIGRRSCQDETKARNAFEKILSSGNLLLGVINDILDFSKIEAGKIHIEQTVVSLTEVIDHAIDLIRERAHGKGLEVMVERAADFPDTCIADPLRLSQVLLNLLSNAVKFTERGGVTLRAARQGNELIFGIIDTGIGIGEDQLGLLFTPFHQADTSTTRRFGGTGLGLAISNRILELMGGSIRVESRAGVGSTFEFRVPYVAVNNASLKRVEEGEAMPKEEEKPLAGIHILVAEDDAINQLVIEENLVEDGASVVVVGNGAEAVERVIQDGPQAYAIVLMDIQMPVMDGYEATRRIRELTPNLPIIGQTAHASVEERDRCLAAGMVAHIAKPIDSRVLVALIRQNVRPSPGGLD